MKVLFVCVANRSRSQVAQALFDSLSTHESESAGTRVAELMARHGESSPRLMDGARPWSIEYMREHGVDISGNQMKQLTREMVDGADRVLVMAERHTWPDYLAASEKVEVWDSSDPDFPRDQIPYAVFDRIKERVEGLVREIG